jgi:hypothetical protein
MVRAKALNGHGKKLCILSGRCRDLSALTQSSQSMEQHGVRFAVPLPESLTSRAVKSSSIGSHDLTQLVAFIAGPNGDKCVSGCLGKGCVHLRSEARLGGEVLAGGALHELVHSDLAVSSGAIVVDQAVAVQHAQRLIHCLRTHFLLLF